MPVITPTRLELDISTNSPTQSEDESFVGFRILTIVPDLAADVSFFDGRANSSISVVMCPVHAALVGIVCSSPSVKRSVVSFAFDSTTVPAQGSNDGFLSCRSILFFKKNIMDVCPDANTPREGGALVDKRCCCRCGVVLLCSDEPVLPGVALSFLRRFVDCASQTGYVIEEPY